jgi:RND family efflux transporter MFP subunit
MKTRKIVLPCLVLVIAVALTVVLVKSRQVPEPKETPYLGPLVQVAELVSESRQVVVSGTGTVRPRLEVAITPQVKGRISAMSPKLVVGGRFRQGELLFAIEDVDYRLAIDLARANLAKAELELQKTRNLAEIARREWSELNPQGGAEPSPLVVYEPQLKSATAQREAADAAVRQAEINLERTRVYAPFNGFVRSEQLEIGQSVGSAAPVMTMVGTDQAEVIVPLPLDELAWLEVPAAKRQVEGSAALLTLRSGDRLFQWQGRITRALGEIDSQSRMLDVVVTVDEPLSADASGTSLLEELMPGMFVEVSLTGETLADVIAVPRAALRDDDSVWLIDDEKRLRIRHVEIVRREPDTVLVSSGLAAGERIVLTGVTGAAEGMLLRTRQEAAQ